ncbi:MAG TPA: hypothetical protein VF079_07480 [Sphingomicrobium sp.]
MTVQLFVGLLILRPLLDLSSDVAAGLTTAGAILFGLYGFFVGWKDAYALERRTVWAFVLDVSWSSLNTVTGLVWTIWCANRGTFDNRKAEARSRGIVLFSGTRAALPGAAATTLGPVVGGRWMLHEAVHVQQARIFGPFYWPVYLVSYATAMTARLLTGRFKDPHWEAYERVVLEDWAYRAAPDGCSAISIPKTTLWFFLTLVNALGVAVLLASVPAVGALIGVAFAPWWIGLLVVILYAVGRSFFPKGRFDSWKPIFNR